MVPNNVNMSVDSKFLAYHKGSLETVDLKSEGLT